MGLVGVLVVLAVVSMVMKKQLAAVNAPVPALQTPAGGSPAAAATKREQAQAVQQQYRQAVEGAMQAPRPTGEEP